MGGYSSSEVNIQQQSEEEEEEEEDDLDIPFDIQMEAEEVQKYASMAPELATGAIIPEARPPESWGEKRAAETTIVIMRLEKVMTQQIKEIRPSWKPSPLQARRKLTKIYQ